MMKIKTFLPLLFSGALAVLAPVINLEAGSHFSMGFRESRPQPIPCYEPCYRQPVAVRRLPPVCYRPVYQAPVIVEPVFVQEVVAYPAPVYYAPAPRPCFSFSWHFGR